MSRTLKALGVGIAFAGTMFPQPFSLVVLGLLIYLGGWAVEERRAT